MAGCGSKKKMAKGGMVSPRKAMAMGKKPKKFAKGGMARSGAPVLNSTNMDPARPRGMSPVNVSGMTGGPRGTMAPMGPKKFAQGGMARSGAPVLNSTNVDTVRPRGMTPVNVTAPRPVMTPRPAQTQTQMRAAVDAAALEAARRQRVMAGAGQAAAALGQVAGLRRPGFKKGGMVKKGKK